MGDDFELPDDLPRDGFLASFPDGPHHLLFCQYPDEPEPRLYECEPGGKRRPVQMADGQAEMMLTASQRLFVAACWAASAELRGESHEDVAGPAATAVLTAIEWDVRLAQALTAALATRSPWEDVDAAETAQTKAYYDRLAQEHAARFASA